MAGCFGYIPLPTRELSPDQEPDVATPLLSLYFQMVVRRKNSEERETRDLRSKTAEIG